ncbi:MAG: ABC transporter substrate-binding protein [Clostridiales bacterium]|jgi:ribose transport system substrate-binding protein|nr:ABC transporter substrate-binding protein [Clostridiales bacterium]
MKELLHTILAAIVAVTMLTACSSSAPNAAPAAETPVAPAAETPAASQPIAIIIPSADHGWMAGVAYFAQQKVKELGLSEGTGYKLLTSANVNEQANQIDEVLGTGVSAVVLLPHNDEVTVAANKITDQGIPLIVFDRKVPNYNAYVAGDNKGIGTETAKYLGEKLNGEGTIAVMNTPSVGSVSTERVDGFKEVMTAQYPNIKLIDVTSAGFTQEDGLKMATDMLVANEQLDAVFSIDDEPSLGILQAIHDAGRTDIKYITGGGGAQPWFTKIQSETGISLLTATYSPAMIGDAVQVANDIVSGKNPESETIITPTIVTKDNVGSFLDAGSPY